MGRVCYHTCEKTCNRGQLDGSVNINLIERSIGDMAISKGWSFVPVQKQTGKKVLIIGAGPSGLSAAYFLRQMGHEITVYESHNLLGGMARYGVPKYRLPRNILDAEIKRILDLGITVETNRKVDALQNELGKFDAVYLATGACLAAKTDVEISEDSNTMDAIDLFQKMEDNPEALPKLGENVLVYGGGNTAIDAARTALRLGAKNVKIVYRRTFNKMPAHETEIQDALAEGIEVLCLRTITSINNNKVLVAKMEFDEEGFIKPVKITFEGVEAVEIKR
jgi:NADPH-dependent glutamate synthase beta subunit-like oxidoreductase